MALSVNWNTGLITCPQSDLTFVSGTKYQITVDYLWQLLRDRSDDEDALAYPILFTNTPPTASTPRIVEINADYYTFQFEDGSYSVDVINGNTNLRDVEVKNTVSIGTNNTTGFINPTFLEAGLFDGCVTVDSLNGVALTSSGYTPDGGIIGTRQTPVNNIPDALIICENRSFRKVCILRSMTVGSGVSAEEFSFYGDHPIHVTITVEAAANVTNCEFTNCTITGTLDGGNVLDSCVVDDIVYFNGTIKNCGLSGTVELGGNTQAVLVDCYSQVAGGGASQYPIIDMGGSGNSLALRDYHGGIGLINYSGGGSVSLDMSSGRVVLNNTLTGGTIYIRGITIIEGSSGGTTVNVTGVLSRDLIAESVWNSQIDSFQTEGTVAFYIKNKILSVAKFIGLK